MARPSPSAAITVCIRSVLQARQWSSTDPPARCIRSDVMALMVSRAGRRPWVVREATCPTSKSGRRRNGIPRRPIEEADGTHHNCSQDGQGYPVPRCEKGELLRPGSVTHECEQLARAGLARPAMLVHPLGALAAEFLLSHSGRSSGSGCDMSWTVTTPPMMPRRTMAQLERPIQRR